MSDMQHPYLFTRKGTRNFQFRRVIPPELRKYFSEKREITKTLGTPDKQEALRLYHKYALEIDEKFAKARQGIPTGTEFDNIKRKRVRKLNTARARKNVFEYAKATGGDEIFDPNIMEVEDVFLFIENSNLRHEIEKFKQQKLLGVGDGRIINDQISARKHLIAGTVPSSEPAPTKGPLLKAVIDEYLDEMKGSLATTTFSKKETHLKEFLSVCRNKPVDGYALTDGTTFLAHLKTLEGRGTGKKLHPNTINGYVRNVKKLFKWSKRYNPQLCNPVKEIDRLAEKRVATDKKPRLSFSHSELEAIFTKIKPKDSIYWPCLIALYTGCRGGEIMQLNVDDIQAIDKIKYFDIHDRNENKLKNDQSNRHIPIHKTLIRLGILEHIENIGSGTLFPALCKSDRWRENGSDKWTNALGNRFHRFLTNHRVKHKQISFHSFRHTFTDGCRNNGVSESVWNWLSGRSESGSVGGYGIGPNMKTKKQEIDKIRYGISIED